MKINTLLFTSILPLLFTSAWAEDYYFTRGVEGESATRDWSDLRNWNTDATWLSSDKKPAQIAKVKRSPLSYAPEEHLAVYKAYVPRPVGGEEETRLYIDYRGDVANLYQNGQLIADSYYDGTDWIVSVDRLQEAADVNPLVIRIKGLESADVPIYFEKEVNPADCVYPTLKSIDVKQEYRFQVVRK